MKYVKKPIEVDAIQYTGDNMTAILEFMIVNNVSHDLVVDGDDIRIETLEGIMLTNVGDYIIVGAYGEPYPCKSYIFDATYDEVI